MRPIAASGVASVIGWRLVVGADSQGAGSRAVTVQIGQGNQHRAAAPVGQATGQAEGQAAPVAPRTARERARAEIAREILDGPRLLATEGAPALSLRAIARRLSIASLALTAPSRAATNC